MSNEFNNIKDVGAVIAKVGAAMFGDAIQFAKTIDKEDASAFDGVNGFQAGATIDVNKHARFSVGSTADVTSLIQDIKEEKVALTLDILRNIAVKASSAEIATKAALKVWAKRFLAPQVQAVAMAVEQELLLRAYQATFNAVGTPGSTVYDTDLALSAGQKIDENGCADFSNRYFLCYPAANRSAVNARKGLFQSSEKIAMQYKEGAMGIADGFTFLRNNLLPTHTNGTDVVFEVRTTVATEGQATLVVEGLTATTGTVTKGTVFTIAGVNAVHPITKADLGYLQQFVATATDTADGSGYATLDVYPAFYTSASKGLQTVTAFPVDGAAITPMGAASTGYKQALAYHSSAFRMASVPLVKPDGLDLVGQETVDGITMRVLRDYDILTDVMIMRLDFLGGFVAVRPEFACRVYG